MLLILNSLGFFKSGWLLILFCLLMQLGGLNSMLTVEHSPSIPMVSKVPTIILGMDVSHGSPGHSDVPSIAAVCFYTLSPHKEKEREKYKMMSLMHYIDLMLLFVM